MSELVSVVIPAYNRASVLPRAVESVLHQTHRPVEIIVVDDGSSDETWQVMERYTAQYPEVVRYVHQENQGVSGARNTGIDHAQGDYVCFLDSDDYFYRDKLEVQLQAMKREKRSLSFCNMVRMRKGMPVETELQARPGRLIEDFFYEKGMVNIGAWLMAAPLIHDHHLRFRPGCSWGEDNEFIIKTLFYAGQAAFISKPLFVFDDHTDTGLSQFSWDKIDKDIFIYNEIWQWLKGQEAPEERKKAWHCAIYQYLVPSLIINRAYMGRRDRSSAVAAVWDHRAYVKEMRPINGIRSVKQLVKLMILTARGLGRYFWGGRNALTSDRLAESVYDSAFLMGREAAL